TLAVNKMDVFMRVTLFPIEGKMVWVNGRCSENVFTQSIQWFIPINQMPEITRSDSLADGSAMAEDILFECCKGSDHLFIYKHFMVKQREEKVFIRNLNCSIETNVYKIPSYRWTKSDIYRLILFWIFAYC